MRKTISTLLAAAAAAISLAAVPSAAQAACAEWQLPLTTTIAQADRWKVKLWYPGDGYWYAEAYDPNNKFRGKGEVRFRSATAQAVDFTISYGWNGGAGRYTGTIDETGYVSGTMQDLVNPNNRTSWRLTKYAKCVRQ